jgi:exopolyphosphatase / guanosine-5'-triphosphate,3'-diphosphate pyrophosphatase
MRAGVIDIGTLKVKFLIADRKPDGKMETVYESNTLTCLGCHMDENGNKPKPENLEKAINELIRCQNLLKKYRVTKVRAVSTHALREMGKVGLEIARVIKQKTGLTVEIISQKEEAELFYKAVLGDFNTDEDFTVLDVGGGSVQILIGNRKEMKNYYLLKTGTSTLWDMFLKGNTEKDHPTKGQLKKAREHILKALLPIPVNLNTPLIWGSSCVIDIFDSINFPRDAFEMSPQHPFKTPFEEMEKFLEKIWKVPLEIRDKDYRVPTPKYMWGIDMALINVIELGKKVKAPYVIPSNANINQGLISSLIS